MYMVMKLAEGIVVQLFGQDLKIPLTQGSIKGAVFIFDDKAEAEAFAEGKFEVVELTAQPGQPERKADEPKIIY